MFQCKFCGYVSQNPHIYWCNNLKCLYYSVVQEDIPAAQQAIREQSSSRVMPQKSDACRKPEPPCNDELQLGFATTPFQRLKSLYSPREALAAGTVFPELNMPWKSRLIKRSY